MVDHFTESIPGSSWGLEMGSLPMDKPPVFVDLEEAFAAIASGLKKPPVKRNIIKLVNSGISLETIASSMAMEGVSTGKFNPDLAEILKYPIVIELFKIVNKKVKKINIDNKPLVIDELDDMSLEETQKSLAPENIDSTPDQLDFVEKMKKISLEDENSKNVGEGFMPLRDRREM
tara:strand:- start:307 stop:831 length:525 start_codon:yes stop_codon:yes gene_type:complete